MAIDYSKLRGKIKEVYNTQQAFADAMGMKRASLSQRLTGAVEWKTPEVIKACGLLDIELSDAHLYFFTLKVVKTQPEVN